MFKQIIVPLDGSPLAEQALDKAFELSKALSAPLLLVRVIDTASATRLAGVGTGAGVDFGLITELLTEEQAEAKEYVEKEVAALKEKGFEVTGTILQGPVAQAIVETASPDDVIVIASHGRTGVQRWFLGSVAEDVIRHAKSPVMLIRGQAES